MTRAARVALGAGILLAAWHAGAGAFEAPAPRDSTFAFTIHPSLPTHRFTVLHDPESGAVTRVEVRRGDDPRVLQVLDGLSGEEPPPGGVDDVAAVDVTFDGYADFKVLSMWGATGNRAYDWFVFDPATGRFVRETSLSDLGNPVPDPETATIHTRSSGGMAGGVFREATYRWEGGSPVCIRAVQQDWDPKRQLFSRVIEEQGEDDLVPVRRGVYFEGEVKRGESFSLPITDSLRFELDPFPGGWEIVVRAADRPDENLARLTPPLHGPNPRQILGWHFARRGPGGTAPNAPQREREFLFSQKVGRTIQGPGSDRDPTWEEIEEIERDGTGTLHIEDLGLEDPKQGAEPEIEWLRFTVTMEFP